MGSTDATCVRISTFARRPIYLLIDEEIVLDRNCYSIVQSHYNA